MLAPHAWSAGRGAAVITSYFWRPDGVIDSDLSGEALSRAFASGEGVLWVDLEAASAEEAEHLSSVFGFHHLAVDDCLNRHVDTPKIDDYDHYLFIIAQGISFHAHSARLETTELDLFLGKNYVVSFHGLPLPAVADVRRRCQENGALLLGRGADYLAHALLDALVDHFLAPVEEMDEVLGRLEEEVLANPDKGTLQEILLLRRNAQRLRRTVLPQRDVVNRFARGEFPSLIREEMRIYFRDIYDHVVRVEEMVESLRELADGVLSTYLSAMNNRMNEIMKVLSIVAAVFLPLTLIASIYGTNFENMPELSWQWGYFGMLGVLAIIAIGLVAYFRWRRWF